MKKIYTLLITIILILMSLTQYAQSHKRIAVYDNTWSNSSGILTIVDTAVYEYSWYYDEWLPFPNTGLVRVNGNPQIDEIACFNNETGNPSGIYVISDTAVFVYNYYIGWIPLSNNGLCRQNGVVMLSDISCFNESSSGTNRIFVISDTSVFRYDWYMQTWYPLSNSGLMTSAKINKENIALKAFPNPFRDVTNISYTLPIAYNSKVRIALFTQEGKFVKEIVNETQTSGDYEYELSAYNLAPGKYFYQICGKGINNASQLIIVK